jgi:hypothetical protein
MKILANPERRGLAGMLGIVLIILAAMAVMNGALEKWFNITWFSGPSIADKCVYISERSGKAELYYQPLSESSAVKITDGANAQSIPSVAPNGRKIIFVAAFKESASIFSIRADGKGLVQMTQATGPKTHPSYSRDGKSIYYIASGKVYIADIDGASPEFILPTREEQSIAINNGQEMPAYKDYAWEYNGDGILAACETSVDVDQLVYMPAVDKEVARIPLSRDPNERVVVAGICAIPGTTAFVVAANVGSNAMIINVDPKTQKLTTYARLANTEVGRPAVAESGDSVVVPARNQAKKIIDTLLLFPVSGGAPEVVSDQHLEEPLFVDGDTKILATKTNEDATERNVVLLDIKSHQLTQLTTDGSSYSASYCPKIKSNQ